VRPTYGRVSRAGAMVCSWTFDKLGPLARSAADCRAILQAISGPDAEDPTSSNEPLRLEVRDARLVTQLRAALVPLDFTGGEPQVKTAFDAAVGELRAAGLRIEEAKLPSIPAGEVAGLIISAEAISAFEPMFRNGDVYELFDEFAPYQAEIGASVTSADLVKAYRLRRALQDEMARFFGRYDVIVTPNFLSVAPRVSDDLTKALGAYTDPVGAIGNACGLPAIALPCGFGKDRLPASFQIMAAPFEEATLLDLGDVYQSRTKHHLARPTIA